MFHFFIFLGLTSVFCMLVNIIIIQFIVKKSFDYLSRISPNYAKEVRTLKIGNAAFRSYGGFFELLYHFDELHLDNEIVRKYKVKVRKLVKLEFIFLIIFFISLIALNLIN